MLLLKVHRDSNQESLMDHVYELSSHRSIDIKKQSLHNRFSPQGVAFIKEIIDRYLKSELSFDNTSLLEAFSKVFVQDATKFGLPEKLQKDYPCYGGSSAKAGGQIQFAYELKSQKVHHLQLCAATQNEALAAINNSWIEKGSLVLRDLGYFTVKGFKEIIEKSAFFISKAKPKTTFFYPNNEHKRLNLQKIIAKMKRNSLDHYELDLIMGFEKKKKLPVRVIFSCVPDKVKEQRLRKASRNSKQRGWTIADEYRQWAGINVFITNVPKEKMLSENISQVYRLRWQVELIFKTWKSHYMIHLHKAVKKERVECYIYASLLLILLQQRIFSWLQHLYDKQKIGLSIHKFCKLMIHLKELFNKAVLKGKANFKELIQILLSLSEHQLIKEEKKGAIGYATITANNLLLSLCNKERSGKPSHS